MSIAIFDRIKSNITYADERPITYRPDHLSISEKEQVCQIITDFKHNIIRDSFSPYASPKMLAKNKNNEVRMCVNDRVLNAKPVKRSIYVSSHRPLNRTIQKKLFC